MKIPHRKQAARSSAQTRERGAAKQPPALARLANAWWDRLISSVVSGSLADQTAQYAGHDQTRDYMYNTAGLALWGGLFPILTMICTHLVGAEQAGMFSMAFVIANLLQFVGLYGVRTFQVSDIDEMDSFGAYQIQRTLACLVMVAAGWLYFALRVYSGEMLSVCYATLLFRLADSLADVYEGRLQQFDKLWLAGVSQGVRCAGAIALFTVALFLTRSITVASIAMAVAGFASLLLLAIPLAYFETPRSRRWAAVEVREVFVECFPAFAAQFLFALIEAIPKFAMEGPLPYDDQLYFNAIYFPAQAILMAVGFMYKPQLVRLAKIWADPDGRKHFDLIVIAVIGAAALVTVVFLAIAAIIGIRVTGWLYGLDFEPYRTQQYLMIVAGGMSAVVDFLYQIITVLRRQEAVTKVYLVGLVVVSAVSFTMVSTVGFDGAVYGYLAVMAVLMVLMVIQYVNIRLHPVRTY